MRSTYQITRAAEPESLAAFRDLIQDACEQHPAVDEQTCYDLKLAVGMGRLLGLRIAAVINRADLGDDQVRRFLHSEAIPVLTEIPFDRIVAEAYAAARLPLDKCESFRRRMTELGRVLLANTGEPS